MSKPAVHQEASLQRKVTCLWKEPEAPRAYRSAIALHGHTNHSKESLYFIAEYASRHRVLRTALAAQERRARDKSDIKVDFWKGYWTPPLPSLAAFQLEQNQIENALGLNGMVSITDHDSIEAPMLLRVVPQARRVPVSLEWTVPYQDAVLHLGVHNLPSARAESIVGMLRQYTEAPVEKDLPGLLKMLDEIFEVLVVFNHPLWNLAGICQQRHEQAVRNFMAQLGMFVHALELNGLRGWQENQVVAMLADAWNVPVISGGDRHGCEPGAVLNLTNAESFTEFVREIRKQRQSHVLFMPQYNEPVALRVWQTLLDVIRDYPNYPIGSRRWDERVFHPDSAGVDRPLATMWRKPPAFIEVIFSGIRLMEMAPVRRAVRLALVKQQPDQKLTFGKSQAATP
jgi:hypothetical protein